MKRVLALFLVTVLAVGSVGCASGIGTRNAIPDGKSGLSSEELTGNTTSADYEELPADQTFRDALNDFSFRMFRASAESAEGNFMVSPLSAVLAFSMLMNGAEGNTLTEMQNTFFPGLDPDTVNRYLGTYMSSLTEEDAVTLNIANSIWVRDDSAFKVKEAFLKANATFYRAAVYKALFDQSTVDDVNSWVSENTDGQIPKIMEDIDPDAVMLLINAICFKGNWEEQYEDYQIGEDDFTKEDGTTVTKQMLSSGESIYLSDENTTGALKYYEGGRYAFAALLPEEGTDLADYISSLTTEKWNGLWESRTSDYDVSLRIPEFSGDFRVDLVKMLQDFGMNDAFDGSAADFSALGEMENGDNIHVSDAFQMTHVELDRYGTKAAAVTVISMVCDSAMPEEKETKTVDLNRPFVYLIVDTYNGIPVFIGTVTE